MKDINFFSRLDEREKQLIEQYTEIKIEDKNYTYDEISNIRTNLEHFYISEKEKREQHQLIKKMNAIEKEFDEKFDYKKWKCKKIFYIEDAKNELDKLDIVGKKIVDIRATDNDIYLSKESMINCYNNNEELMEKPEWTLMKKITKSYIPETIERGVVASFGTPIILFLDDNSTIELIIKDYSKLYISKNKLTNNYQYNIDTKKLFNEIINKKIISYEVISYENKNPEWRYHIDKRIKGNNNINIIKIRLEDEYEFCIYPKMFLLMQNGKAKITTIGEWKKCVKHYDWLYSKKAEERYKGEGRELTKEEETLLELLKHTDVNKATMIGTISLLNGTEKQLKLIDYLIECSERGTIENQTNDTILRKCMEILGIETRE